MRVLRQLLSTYHRIIFTLQLTTLTMGTTREMDYDYQDDGQQPEFLPRPTNVSFNKGDTAVLVCGIHNLGTKTVIWRRASDPNPLTIGTDVYVSDPRYSASASPEHTEWRLYIRDVTATDAGVYECQISSRDKLINHILLRINSTDKPDKPGYVSYTQDEEQTPPKVKDEDEEQIIRTSDHKNTGIFVSGTKFVEKGDPIHLVCNSTGVTDSPDNLDWFRDGIKLTPDGVRQIKIDKFHVRATRTLVSVLEIKHSRMEDAGTYVCRSGMSITSTKVHVLNAGSTNVRRGTSATDKAEGVGSDQQKADNSEQSKRDNSMAPRFSASLTTLLFLSAVTVYLNTRTLCSGSVR